MKKNNYNKTTLVRELAFNTGIPQKKARAVLDALRQIAYREACDQGITIPGICRLDVIRRKARKMRNPQTGETILIAEHDSLRVRILKKARNIVTPPPENMVTVVETPITPSVIDDFSNAVSFCCAKCGQEIEAPLSAAGMNAECPACGSTVTIPKDSEPGTLHGPPAAAQPPPPPVPASQPAASPSLPSAAFNATKASTLPPHPGIQNKSQTIRIDLAALGFDNAPATPQPLPRKRMLSFFCKNCSQEIEAPADMAGSATECPSCGVSFEVPFFSDPGTLHGSDLEHKQMDATTLKSIKNRTIRIEVPDDV
ncbi:MAG: HU family DNA-binding protein [Kiritimatiellae bacterium]|nr:HU family DNA-binding protein [Kiritimatiellia bacterium]